MVGCVPIGYWYWILDISTFPHFPFPVLSADSSTVASAKAEALAKADPHSPYWILALDISTFPHFHISTFSLRLPARTTNRCRLVKRRSAARKAAAARWHEGRLNASLGNPAVTAGERPSPRGAASFRPSALDKPQRHEPGSAPCGPFGAPRFARRATRRLRRGRISPDTNTLDILLPSLRLFKDRTTLVSAQLLAPSSW